MIELIANAAAVATPAALITSTALPEWVLFRAAHFMLRRYGTLAHARAIARHQFLLRIGDRQGADDWIRVANAIANLSRSKRRGE